MDCIELAKQVEKYKIIRAFEDGVTDALIHGVRDDSKTHHFYKQGYDFGLVLWNKLQGDNDG